MTTQQTNKAIKNRNIPLKFHGSALKIHYCSQNSPYCKYITYCYGKGSVVPMVRALDYVSRDKAQFSATVNNLDIRLLFPQLKEKPQKRFTFT